MKRCSSFIAALGVCFLGATTAANAQVRADTGSIAIGGSVTSSTVIIGIPQQKVDELVRDARRPLEELTAQQRENIALLKEKLTLMDDRYVPRWPFSARMTFRRSVWQRSLSRSQSDSRNFGRWRLLTPVTMSKSLP